MRADIGMNRGRALGITLMGYVDHTCDHGSQLRFVEPVLHYRELQQFDSAAEVKLAQAIRLIPMLELDALLGNVAYAPVIAVRRMTAPRRPRLGALRSAGVAVTP